ncbi:hypothetical protein BDA96_01G354000 [Sorghum bicolor]|uniref:Uncharacterized protein n=2 Tax=Sorghum bicolor TaxID=4558 RepID=A0A921S254_SORBI|nr:hypothetical protein BDA96_01G354000 [Sorghum bicolor]OQU92344.1 hypothetical protein SORBI_3001G330775 [Sorghum bicolor]
MEGIRALLPSTPAVVPTAILLAGTHARRSHRLLRRRAPRTCSPTSPTSSTSPGPRALPRRRTGRPTPPCSATCSPSSSPTAPPSPTSPSRRAPSTTWSGMHVQVSYAWPGMHGQVKVILDRRPWPLAGREGGSGDGDRQGERSRGSPW